MDALLSIADVLGCIDIGRTKLYEELRSGRLRSVRVGSRRLVPRSAIDEWIANLDSDFTS